MNKIEKFEIAPKVITDIQALIDNTPGESVIDIIVDYSEINSFDIEFVAGIIKTNAALTSLLQEQAEKVNMMKTKISRLPV